MPKRNNAIAKKGFKNKPSTNNNVNFHPVVVDLTFKYLKPHYDYIVCPKILDACSGIDGILGRSLSKSRLSVFSFSRRLANFFI